MVRTTCMWYRLAQEVTIISTGKQPQTTYYTHSITSHGVTTVEYHHMEEIIAQEDQMMKRQILSASITLSGGASYQITCPTLNPLQNAPNLRAATSTL